MMSSSRDRLLCLISCFGGSSGGLAVVGWLVGLAGTSVLVAAAVLKDLVGAVALIGSEGATTLTGLDAMTGLADVKDLTKTLFSAVGTTILATFVFEATLYVCALAGFLTLIMAAVVEVPQSEQLSLYGERRRPHFRQNGIDSH